MKKLINVLVLVVLGVLVVNQVNLVKEQNAQQEKELVESYVECLQDNFTQRDYCARQISDTNYRILDQKLEKYGYKYTQKGYDLYIEKVEK